MLDTAIQRRLDAMITSCRLYELPPEQRQLASILIRNCRADITRWPGMADDIIQDCRMAIEGLREEAEA